MSDRTDVPVEQVDRDAAADWLADDDDAPDMLHFAGEIRAGRDDKHSLVQAFARHRLASPQQLDAGRVGARETVAALVGDAIYGPSRRDTYRHVTLPCADRILAALSAQPASAPEPGGGLTDEQIIDYRMRFYDPDDHSYGAETRLTIRALRAALGATREPLLDRIVRENGPVVVDAMGGGLAWRPLVYGTWAPLTEAEGRA